MNLDKEQRSRWSTGIALSLLSMSVVSYEIQLMHFFSIVQWQHFATMVISIALLGFGASGTLLTLFRRKFAENSDLLIPLFMISTSLLMTVSFPLSRANFLLFDSYTLFVDPSQIGRLTATYLVFFLPFLCAALAIGLIFITKASEMGRYYFADLTGAGLGGLFALALMWITDFNAAGSIISVLPLVSGLILVPHDDRRKLALLATFALSVFVVLMFLRKRPLLLITSQYKSISYALNLPEARITEESQSPYGMLQVVNSPVQRYAPGLSLSFQEEVPPVPVIFNNGNWHAAIPVHRAADILEHTPMALPYSLRPVKTALLLHSGAGFEARHALEQGVDHLDAVEPNAMVLKLLGDEYAQRTDSLYFDPAIAWHQTTPRSFIQKTKREYDLVQLPLLGTFGGSVGLNALDEDWIMTREGFEDVWKGLADEGLLSVSCWIDVPQKMSIRISALISDLLERKGIEDPGSHVMIIRSWGVLTFVVSKNPISPEERNKGREFCDNLQFDVVSLEASEETPSDAPSSNAASIEFNLIQDQSYERNLRSAFEPERDSLIGAYPFNVRVPTDNKPYFFQFLKLGKWNEQRATWGESSVTFLELGYFLVLLTFVQLLILALVFIVLPLFKVHWKSGERSRVVAYFASLGLGYMFIEIVLIKYFQIFLGHPIYSISIVISTMLISSGLGSRHSESFGLNRVRLRKAIAYVGLVAILYALVLGTFLHLAVGYPFWMRVSLSLVLVAIPAFFMGMPFPLGIKLLDESDKSQVPWAWGVNGCVSVISTTLAAIVAVEAGFTAVMLLAGAAYALAYLSVPNLRN